MLRTTIFALSLALFVALKPASGAPEAKATAQAEAGIQTVFNRFCVDCHGPKKQKGKVRLDHFAGLSNQQKHELLGDVEEQIYLGEMPPEDKAKAKQPTPAERKAWLDAIKNWNKLRQVKSAFSEKLTQPGYGNYIDHDKLFSGEFKNLKAFTYDRQWLISEFIFNQKMNELLNRSRTIKDRGKQYELCNDASGFANPFGLPNISGVRYFANEQLTGGQFLTMVGNAKSAANTMIDSLAIKSRDYLPAAKQIMSKPLKHNQIIATRRAFLEQHMPRLCEEIYKAENASWLPKHPRIVLPKKIKEEADHYGKWGWRNRIGYNEGAVFQETLRVIGIKNKSKKELIEQCAQYWYHDGESQAAVERRIYLLGKEMASILKYQKGKLKPYAYKPLGSSEMVAIKATIKKFRTKGMPYKKIIQKCVAQWETEFRELREKSRDISDDLIAQLLTQLYQRVHNRKPTSPEVADQSALFRVYVKELGELRALKKMAQTLILSTEFIARDEFGTGKADAHARRMLSPRAASYAIAYALTDSKPDEQLVKAAREGRLNSREDYRREVLRLLSDRSKYYVVDHVVHGGSGVENITNQPVRKLRFFREFFGFHKVLKLFKDDKRYGGDYLGARRRILAEADRLVEYILDKDKKVFEELLTTDQFYAFHSGDNEHMRKHVLAHNAAEKKRWEYFERHNWRDFTTKDLNKHKKMIKISFRVNKHPVILARLKKDLTGLSRAFGTKGYHLAPDRLPERFGTGGRHSSMGVRHAVSMLNIDPDNWNFPIEQPVKLPNRKGLLTHPAWLIAFSQNTHTDPVTRGKWIREKLLAGTVPDVPITVDAAIPDDKTKTLRERLAGRTQTAECWKCHKLMNPLGNAFEMYDDFGRYRTEEELEHPDNILNLAEEAKVKPMHRDRFRYRYKTKALDTTGVLDGTHNSKLDGKVKDAIDMVERLAKSKRVRQSIIRHAFRYFMGRNERLSDSKTLMDADEAYVKSGGSFDAVIVSLLTSDSFIYRKEVRK